MKKNHRYGLILLSIVIAFCLTILPLPEWAQLYRPYWLMLVIIFWTLVLPDGFGVGISWFIGLLLDVMYGTLLGQYAVAMLLVSYLTYKLHYQLRVFPVWQQSIAVFLFISLAQLFVLWTNILTGQSVMTYWQYGIGIFISALIWPLVYALLNSYQHRYRI
ncbi:MAG: rod shape-determining protein MreD [Gammaproteobacteria bacterium]